MHQWRGGSIAILGALLQSAHGGSANSSPRDCGLRETEPVQFANRRGAVEWGSDADRLDPNADSTYSFSRFIANSGPEPLLVHWEVGRLLLTALDPGHVAMMCERLPMRPYMIYGPIAVERQLAPVQTTVWEAGYDARDVSKLSGRTLETLFRIAAEGKEDGIAVRVLTTLLPGDTGGEFSASYAIENDGAVPIEVTWPVAPPIIRPLTFSAILGARASGSQRVSWHTAAGLPIFVHVPLILSAQNSRAVIAILTVPTFVVRESAAGAR